jgi:hypothetical protein
LIPRRLANVHGQILEVAVTVGEGERASGSDFLK